MIFYSEVSFSQSDSSHLDINGYVKDLQTFTFVDNADSISLDNLVHHRLNINWHPGNHFALQVGMRNRIFTGWRVQNIPDFGEQIKQQNGLLDLSVNWVNEKSLVINSQFDRLNVQWKFKNGYVKIGRQRVNWGINTTWNPNDIFNAYNFLDFDYEERPGTDAARFSYNLNSHSDVEVTVSPAKEDSLWVAAVKYDFNVHGYDFQVFAGNFQTDITAGFGWAGNISQAGWKGELTYFQPKENFLSTAGDVSVSSGIDYAFAHGWYASGSFLYNSAAPDQITSADQLTAFQLSAKTLMPTKLSLVAEAAKKFTPLFSGNFSVVYSPKVNLLILLPYLSYSIAENWDLDLFWQAYFADNSEREFKVFGNEINL
ncbi:MAG: hypothetical protein ACHQD9_09025, partial [Chitinophagales bacterium]